MFWLWLHLAAGGLILLAVIITIIKDQAFKSVVMAARVGYLAAIISGSMLFSYAWGQQAVLTLLKVVIALGAIGFCEVLFARVQQFTWATKALVLVVILAVGILGMVLSGGYPLIGLG
jgi:hypothetical protein